MSILKTAIGVALGIVLAAAIGFAAMAAVQNYGHRKTLAAERANASSLLTVQGCAIRGPRISGAVRNGSRFDFADVRVMVTLVDAPLDTERTLTIDVPLAFANADTGFSAPLEYSPGASIRSVSVAGRLP